MTTTTTPTSKGADMAWTAPTLAEMNAERAEQAADQALVNLFADRLGLDAARDLAHAKAEQWHARYPQYAGHFDGWALVRATRRVEGKGGLTCEADDYMLGYVRPSRLVGCRTEYAVLSGRRQTVCVVGPTDFEVVA